VGCYLSISAWPVLNSHIKPQNYSTKMSTGSQQLCYSRRIGKDEKKPLQYRVIFIGSKPPAALHATDLLQISAPCSIKEKQHSKKIWEIEGSTWSSSPALGDQLHNLCRSFLLAGWGIKSWKWGVIDPFPCYIACSKVMPHSTKTDSA
jgi:hypothetical protein